MGRLIAWTLEIDWDRDGTYIDESARLISALGQAHLGNPEDSLTAGRGMVDRATLTLGNADGRYSPLNEAGDLYAALQAGGAYHAPVRLDVAIDGGSAVRVFTGVIKLPAETTATSKAAGRITLDCRSRDELILNARLSSERAQFATIKDETWTEDKVIAAWLTAAGLTDGTDFVSQAWHAANPGTPATLDPGMWPITWAWLDDESPLEDIWALAAAAGGRFYCDPAGMYRYENAAHWLQDDHQTAAASLTKADFTDLAARYNDRDLFSGVSVEASPRFLLEEDTVWESDSTELIGAGETRTITAHLRQPIYTAAQAVYTGVTAGGTVITNSLTVSLAEYAQRVEITIENTHPSQAAIMAALSITAQAADGGPTLEEIADSSTDFWADRLARRKQIRGNHYVQNGAQAGFLAEFLRDRFQAPRLNFLAKNTPGAPGRRLGDRIGLTDADLMTTPRAGLVIAYTWRLSDKGYRQDLELIDAAGLYMHEGDYFILGSNRLGMPIDGATPATSTDPGRCFY